MPDFTPACEQLAPSNSGAFFFDDINFSMGILISA